MAQGVAMMLGFEVGQNFASPYLTTNIRDFWRRWHISLSNWLRDYLYISLGGSKKGSRFLNVLITQTLGGLWHGAHLRYLVWGLGHGLAVGFTQIVLSYRARRERAWKAIGFKPWQIPEPKYQTLKKVGGFLFTINFVSFMWILFRADSFAQALEVAKSALDFSKAGQGAPIMVWIIVFLTFFGQWVGEGLKEAMIIIQERLSIPALSLWTAFWVIMIIKTGPDGVLPFIYFQY
jgi:D-alanyl-lipoteichoic acid acyltransferase DltB (MBOAT superfamily)